MNYTPGPFEAIDPTTQEGWNHGIRIYPKIQDNEWNKIERTIDPKLEREWLSFLLPIISTSNNENADKVAAIMRARLAGAPVNALILNMVNKNQNINTEDDRDTFPHKSSPKLQHDWCNIVRTTGQKKGDPVATQVSDIIHARMRGINVDVLMSSIINDHKTKGHCGVYLCSVCNLTKGRRAFSQKHLQKSNHLANKRVCKKCRLNKYHTTNIEREIE